MPTPALTNINLPAGSGIPAIGSVLSILSLAGGYHPIGNLGNMKWNAKVMDADTTNQGTVWKQSIPTLRDGGTITGDLHFQPGSGGADVTGTLEGHSFIDGLGFIFVDADVRQYRLVWPDGSGMFFAAYITDFPVDMSVEKDLLCNITWKVTGQVTFFGTTGGATTQTITFPAVPTQSHSAGPAVLAATASSGLAVQYSITSGPGFVSGNIATFTAAGSVIISATQPGNGTYAAATAVPVTVVVT